MKKILFATNEDIEAALISKGFELVDKFSGDNWGFKTYAAHGLVLRLFGDKETFSISVFKANKDYSEIASREALVHIYRSRRFFVPQQLVSMIMKLTK